MSYTLPELPPKLVQANIALFKGERAEALRLIEEFRAQNSTANREPHQVTLLWMEAQAQGEHEERLNLLRELVTGTSDSIYHTLAQELLDDEDAFRARMLLADQARRRTTRMAMIIGGLAGVLVAVLVVGGLFFPPQSDAVAIMPEVTSTPAATATMTALPDLSRPLSAESFTKRYPGGILQVIAYELPSNRVITINTNQSVSPVTGAQFVALKLNFECRSGICNAPPEAQLIIQLDSGDAIPAREDVRISGETLFMPVALGHSTTGWAIFEVPLVGVIRSLVIIPQQDQTLREVLPLSLEN